MLPTSDYLSVIPMISVTYPSKSCRSQKVVGRLVGRSPTTLRLVVGASRQLVDKPVFRPRMLGDLGALVLGSRLACNYQLLGQKAVQRLRQDGGFAVLHLLLHRPGQVVLVPLVRAVGVLGGERCIDLLEDLLDSAPNGDVVLCLLIDTGQRHDRALLPQEVDLL